MLLLFAAELGKLYVSLPRQERSAYEIGKKPYLTIQICPLFIVNVLNVTDIYVKATDDSKDKLQVVLSQ